MIAFDNNLGEQRSSSESLKDIYRLLLFVKATL